MISLAFPYFYSPFRALSFQETPSRLVLNTSHETDQRILVYSLLVNRVQFQREQLTQPHQQSVCTTRALLCELVANRILRRFHEDNTGAKGLLLLSQILVGGFDPFQGAPSEVIEDNTHLSWTIQTRTGYKRKLPALEIAIISESKNLLSSSACQKVVNASTSNLSVPMTAARCLMTTASACP